MLLVGGGDTAHGGKINKMGGVNFNSNLLK